MTLKDWLPSLITFCGGVLLWTLATLSKSRGAKSTAAKTYSEKVFQEMTALFDELKQKAKEAEDRAQMASLAAQEAQKRAQEAQATVTEAHSSVTAAQASASQAQVAATEAQRMVADGFTREAENQRQLTAAWDRIDSLSERVRVMEQANAALMGGALGLNPRGQMDGGGGQNSGLVTGMVAAEAAAISVAIDGLPGHDGLPGRDGQPGRDGRDSPKQAAHRRKPRTAQAAATQPDGDGLAGGVSHAGQSTANAGRSDNNSRQSDTNAGKPD